MIKPDVLDVRSPQQWEARLEGNHDTVAEVWLRLFNKAAGEVPLSYGEAVNVERVQHLLADGRMRAPGQRHVDAAKADGRWPTS
jgi:uncharacterized protein YdeI (YjbR/CyaY-like superfamily)